MDIQRQAFEESNNVNPDWSFKFDEELQQYIALDSEMELQVDEFNEHWDTFRAGWQAAKASAVHECTWSPDQNEEMWGNWHTSCGEIFTLNEGTPTEHKLNHCCYCGGLLIEAQEQKG